MKLEMGKVSGRSMVFICLDQRLEVLIFFENLGAQHYTGWWFGTFFVFFHILGMIIPTDEVHHFSEG